MKRLVLVGVLLVGGCAMNPVVELRDNPAFVYHTEKDPRAVLGCITPKWAEWTLGSTTTLTEKGYIMTLNGGMGPTATVGVEPVGTGSEVRFAERFHVRTWIADAVRNCK